MRKKIEKKMSMRDTKLTCARVTRNRRTIKLALTIHTKIFW